MFKLCNAHLLAENGQEPTANHEHDTAPSAPLLSSSPPSQLEPFQRQSLYPALPANIPSTSGNGDFERSPSDASGDHARVGTTRIMTPERPHYSFHQTTPGIQ